MDVRPGVIKNYAQRHVISDNHCFAVYGISIIDKNGDIVTNYAQWANDIKYFNSVADFQCYVNKTVLKTIDKPLKKYYNKKVEKK